MGKITEFLIKICIMFLNVFLFQTVWNEGILFFFPSMMYLTYWYAFLFYSIKNLFGLHINYDTFIKIQLMEEGRSVEEIGVIQSLTTTIVYLIVILFIKIII